MVVAKVVLSALLLSSAGLGVGAFTGAIPLMSAGPGPEDPFGGEVIEEFALTFDQPITSGDLDLRIDEGDVRVIGWDQNAYLVQVRQAASEQGDVSDYQTVVEFNDASRGSHIGLTATVTRDGTYNVGTGSGLSLGDNRPATAIVAFVPAAASYGRVLACSGRDDPFSDVDWWPLDEEHQPAVTEPCLPVDQTPDLGGSINVMGGDEGRGLNVTFGAENIHGNDLTFFTDHGSIVANGIDAKRVVLQSAYGELTLFHASADEVVAETQYGDISVKGAIGSLAGYTEYGQIAAQLDAAGDGRHQVFSSYGEVALLVPHTPGIGYKVEAGTDYGDIRILLADAAVHEDHPDDGFSLDPSSWFMGGSYDRTARAETEGFASLPDQVIISAFTEYGDVLVADGTILEEIEDEDDEGDEDLVALDRLLAL